MFKFNQSIKKSIVEESLDNLYKSIYLIMHATDSDKLTSEELNHLLDTLYNFRNYLEDLS